MFVETYSAELNRYRNAHKDYQTSIPVTPGLAEALEIFPPRDNELLLGVAVNGDHSFPMTINLSDPMQGPMLITGGDDCGKSKILLNLVHQVVRKQSPYIGSSVITSKPNEWGSLSGVPGFDGIQWAGGPNLRSFIREQNVWARENKKVGNPNSRVVIIQNLLMCKEQEDRSGDLPDLLEFFAHASEGGVTIVTSADVYSLVKLSDVLESVRTNIIGYMSFPEDAGLLGLDSNPVYQSLTPKVEFIYAQIGEKGRRFWAPTPPLYNSLNS